MKKVIYIAFSDIQLEDWRKYSKLHSRLIHGLRVLSIIKRAHEQHGALGVLFAGDFFDNPKSLENLVITQSFKKYKRTLSDKLVYAISGNHDQSESNTPTNRSPTHLELYNEAFEKFNLIDYKFVEDKFARIFGIPYLKNNVGFVDCVNEFKKNLSKTKKNILLTHADYSYIDYDNKRSSGRVENIPLELKKLFKGFDLVLSGHIHKPQVIRRNVVMLGAPNHQRISDMGVDMGYWLIYEDLTYKFIKIKLPEFKEGEDQGDGHFYIPKMTEIENSTQDPSSKVFSTLDPLKLGKRYLTATNQKNINKLKILEEYLNKSLSV